MIQLSGSSVLQKFVRSVGRLHNAPSLRPRSVVGDVAGGSEHGQLLQEVVTAEIEAIAVEYAGRDKYRMEFGIIEPDPVRDHIAENVLVPAGFKPLLLRRCLDPSFLQKDSAIDVIVHFALVVVTRAVERVDFSEI